MIKYHFINDWKKRVLLMRTFEILPSLSVNMHENYSFESIRFSWMGLMVGVYIEPKNKTL